MGRPPISVELRAARSHLAVMLDEAIKQGHRASGLANKPWTEQEFATAVRGHVTNVRKWRNRDNPERPVNIQPILNAFYAKDAPARNEMEQAWRRAGGLNDTPSEPREMTTRTFSEIAAPVDLLVNQPEMDNQGVNLIVPYILRLRVASGCTIEAKVDGQPVAMTFDIGLSKPWLQVQSSHWQPVNGSIFRSKPHDNIDIDATWKDAVLLTGPTENGCVVGQPLRDEPNIVMEPAGSGGDGRIVVSVKADPETGFMLTACGEAPPNDRQRDIIHAILNTGIPRDNDKRMEIASVTVYPPKPKD